MSERDIQRALEKSFYRSELRRRPGRDDHNATREQEERNWREYQRSEAERADRERHINDERANTLRRLERNR